jgi:hypothetical protein
MPDPLEPPAVHQQTLAMFGSADYPVLHKLGKQNIRKFIIAREAYVREIEELNAQVGVENGRPVSLAFSIDAMLLTSLVDLRRLGADIDTVDKVSDNAVQSWLDANCDVKKDGMSLAQVHALISKKLNINMAEKDTEQRTVMLFTDYSSLLRMNGLSWIIKDCPKIAIGHILETLKPKPLQTRVRGDLELGHTHLKKDFLKFMEHTIKRAEVYSDYEEPSQIS